MSQGPLHSANNSFVSTKSKFLPQSWRWVIILSEITFANQRISSSISANQSESTAFSMCSFGASSTLAQTSYCLMSSLCSVSSFILVAEYFETVAGCTAGYLDQMNVDAPSDIFMYSVSFTSKLKWPCLPYPRMFGMLAAILLSFQLSFVTSWSNGCPWIFATGIFYSHLKSNNINLIQKN